MANKPASRVAAAAGGCILLDTQVLRTWIGLSHAAHSHSWLTDVEVDLGNGGSYGLHAIKILANITCHIHIDHDSCPLRKFMW